jgi:hypothetical protein
MPKKKPPATLKLTFQENREYQFTDKGKPVKPVRYIEALQFYIESFFSKPLPQRLEELSNRLEKTKKTADLAWRFRNIKMKIEECENPPLPAGVSAMVSNTSYWSDDIDAWTQSKFLHAITSMLNQLMVESLLGRSGEPVNHSKFMRQVAELGDDPKITKKTLEQVRYCLRDKALSDFLGVQQVGGSETKVSATDNQAKAFAYEYPNVLKHWQDIKGWCRSHSETWRDLAQVGTIGAPDFLLDLMNNGHAYNNEPFRLATYHAAMRVNIEIWLKRRGKLTLCSYNTLNAIRKRGAALLEIKGIN